MNYVYPLFKVHMPASVEKPLLETLFSGYLGQGSKVNEFEDHLKGYIGNPYALTTNSATSGLQLALRLFNLKPDDEIITTPLTCTATNMSILASGARIVWADINPLTGNIDPGDIEKKITGKTRAILVVHWGGYPCDIDEINTIAAAHGLKVIEDAAHAFGAEYKNKKIGNHSDFVVFSFQAIKHITTSDGGVLFCKHELDYNRAKLLRWYGIDRENTSAPHQAESLQDIQEWGYKFHMNDLCASIGIEQLKYIYGILESHRSNARYYDTAFAGTSVVSSTPGSGDRKSAYWLYTLHIRKKIGDFISRMKAEGIMVSQVHARNDQYSAFKEFRGPDLNGVDAFSASMVCIPVGWWIDACARTRIARTIIDYADC